MSCLNLVITFDSKKMFNTISRELDCILTLLKCKFEQKTCANEKIVTMTFKNVSEVFVAFIEDLRRDFPENITYTTTGTILPKPVNADFFQLELAV